MNWNIANDLSPAAIFNCNNKLIIDYGKETTRTVGDVFEIPSNVFYLIKAFDASGGKYLHDFTKVEALQQ